MNVSTATTAELVAYYNANVSLDKQIKKFADRKTAEMRVSKLFASTLEMQAEVRADEFAAVTQEAAVQSSVYGFEVHGLYDCPHCDIHLSNGVSQHGDDVNGKPLRHDTHMFECMGCGGGFGDPIKRAAASATRPSGIAASWAVSHIAAKRKERTGNIEVHIDKKLIGAYRSVAHAYTSLGFPLNGHIPFRMALKVERTKDLGVYTFSIAS